MGLTQRTGVPVRGRDTKWARTEEGARQDTVGLPSQLCQYHSEAADLGFVCRREDGVGERNGRESASQTAGVRQETSTRETGQG